LSSPSRDTLHRPERRAGLQHNEAFSFQIATDSQEETDRYWNAIVGNGGQSECGWCKDKWGISWQITPRVLTRRSQSAVLKPSARSTR
jgi:predicted 3-demethylubiquinone-9 3-methyltransferase (glyoxalase superfamily)